MGKIINTNKEIFPDPLSKIGHGLFGFASNKARHIKEGEEPTLQEAQLVFGASLVLVNYLTSVIETETYLSSLTEQLDALQEK